MLINQLVFIFWFLGAQPSSPFLLPVNAEDRTSIHSLQLTTIGEFGLLRKERPGIPAHYHTGIDVKRPSRNYADEPVFPITEGVVISKRTDGPYAQLIIEHHGEGQVFWTLYEHIAGIRVEVGQHVEAERPIARYMNTWELNKHGWQFDHFHFEVLKVRPMPLKPDQSKPDRHFSSYTLACYTDDDLRKYFHNPLQFLSERLH
jgi:murein DD-endopeptidase MepM/ murein hydrolase activator NlpD